MNQIKKLAGQTAYYGISSILARVLNFFLLPIWTKRLDMGEYGSASEVYGFVALLLVIYTFGMETAFFRFARKGDLKKVYQSSTTAVGFISLFLSTLIFLNADDLALYLGKEVNPSYVQYIAAILFIDAFIAIPFAMLRLKEKALRFAVIKTTIVSITITLNLLFLVVFPDILAGKYLDFLAPSINKIYEPNMAIGYIFISNLIANLCYFPLLWRELSELRLTIHWPTLKAMVSYAFPLFLMGLAGMFNEQGFTIIFEWAYPVEELLSPTEALGVFSATVKLSVIMMLGIQAFRYAAEPFFFNHADNKEAPELFAKIMHYFFITNVVVLVAVTLNTPLISEIFIQKASFTQALYVLPVLLGAKLFYGVYINLSVWFKIKDKTQYGSYFAGIGAIITLCGNLLLIPVLGFLGSALSSLFCYLTMSLLCYLYGKKYFPVPYQFSPLFIHLIIGIALIVAAHQITVASHFIQYGIQIAITLIYAALVFRYEWKHLQYKTQKN
jgi:O-antigen/teichoic acid export membrane protein